MDYPVFKNKSVNFEKLVSYGFKEDNGIYVFNTTILDGQFKMYVNITASGEVSTKLIDTLTQDAYSLHLVESASGTFVGIVRSEFNRILEEIAEKCFETDVFKSEQARKIIDYINKKYGDELEFLWEKFPTNAIWRRKDNNKWYAILMVLSRRKLGIAIDEIIDIIDLRTEPNTINTIVDNKKYFPGYHMNKKHWITVCLDNTLLIEELYKLIDKSYLLAK